MNRIGIIFLLCLPMMVLCNTPEMSLWDHVVKMEQVVLSVEFNGRRLNVWRENKENYSRFFTTPLVVMDSETISCSLDEYSNEPRYIFSFFVRLWDSLAAETVKLALKQKGIEAKSSDILPLPMQMVRLGVSRYVTSNIEVDDQWRSNQDQPNVILFELYTKNGDFCEKMAKDAKQNPETFLSRVKLNFEFSLLVGQQDYRNINITGKTFAKSNFFTSLLNDHSDKNGNVYLQSSDMNQLARDIYRVVSAEEEVTSTYIQSNQENQIIESLLGVIQNQEIHSSDVIGDEWNSVFWDDIFARPDIQTEYFNKVLTYDEGHKEFKYNAEKDREFRGKIEQEHNKQSQSSRSGGGGFSFMGFGINGSGSKGDANGELKKGQNDTETKEHDIASLEDLEKFIRKNDAYVKWTGTKFEKKDLSLYRLNTRALKSTGEILYKRVVTTKLPSTQQIEIRPEPKYKTDFNNTISPIYYEDLEARMNQLNVQISEMKTQIGEMQTQIETLNTKIDTSIQEINQQISTHVANLQNQIAERVHEHNDLKNLHNQLSSHVHGHVQNSITDINNYAHGLANELHGRINALSDDYHHNVKKTLQIFVDCAHVVWVQKGLCIQLPRVS